ncbi:hypothetical protein ACYFX5_09390 [Bremerella sp. T1]|uniref:hypothetical protein n=1 Tax=Bremerella sp. TYQ1 TaxID=3119568 RepID=UPI001CCE3404|nr:hypothetical protein [Bremerella volcania]UBM38466.1 hypothetical protein LA756_11330 [Bremerella volcania]
MSNPYSSPSSNNPSHNSTAKGAVSAPAIALMVVSIIAIVLGLLGLVGDVFLILSGAIERLEENDARAVSRYTSILVRTVWGILLLVAATFVLYGAVQMKSLTNYSIAKAAAIVAMIPLLGPCCVLGIPFGIWAIIVLGKPEVRDAFR